MKIRDGFVSNSSSSSFCLLGTWNQDIIDKLNEKDIEDEVTCKRVFKYYSGDEDGDCVGISTDILETHTLPEARQYFVDLCKSKFDVDVDIKNVYLVHDTYYC